MPLSTSSALIWMSAVVLEACLVFLACRNRLFARLPFFTCYLFLLLANDVIMFSVYETAGFRSRTAFYSYWSIQTLCILVRATVVYEVCRKILSPYRGIWRIGKPVLLGIAAILILFATVTTREESHQLFPAVLAGERGLELVVVGILIGGLIFCRYYRIRIERYVVWIAFGLGFYSALQVGDNTVFQHWFGSFNVWERLRDAAFQIAMVMWAIALWKPLPVQQAAPALLNTREYERLAPAMSLRLRTLNTRLLEMWK